MKILLLALIFASISYIGYQYGNSYKEKENFYSEFNNFLMHLKSQISFLKVDLISIFKEYQTNNKNLKILINNFENKLSNNKRLQLSILNDEENLELSNFFQSLGKSDCFTQDEILEHHIKIFNQKLNESKDANLKYGNMYKKLGVLLAIFICTVLI